MKLYLVTAIMVVVGLPAASLAQQPLLSPELGKLDVSVGHWIFHGESLDTKSGKAGTWTWNEDCRWSPNRLFLECTFDNEWSGKTVRSLVVDTYNSNDRSFWHYEFFAEGADSAHPFVSRMKINGDTWTEFGTDRDDGETIQERIVYHFVSPTRVTVDIEISSDGTHWTTVDRGVGEKR